MIASLFDPWARQEGVEPRLRALRGTDQITGADGLSPFLLATAGGGSGAAAAAVPASSAGGGANATAPAPTQPRTWLQIATGMGLSGSGAGSQVGGGSGGTSPGSDGSPPRPLRDQHTRRAQQSPPGGAKATLPHGGPGSPPPAGGAIRAHGGGAAATGSPPQPPAPQRPPLPPSFSLLTSVGSGGSCGCGPAAAPLDALHVSPGGPRDLPSCRSLCSSLGTCSDDDQQPPPSSSGAPTPAPLGAALGLDAALLGAPSARSPSFGSGGCCAARRASLLGDLGRASSCARRASSADGLGGLLAAACSSGGNAGACCGGGCSGPPSPCPCGAGAAPATPPPAGLLRRSLPEGRAYHPAAAAAASPPLLASPQLTPAPSDDAAPWWGARWSWGSYSDQNGRQHMEDRLAAADVSGHRAFAGHRRAGFFAVFDGHAGAEAAEHLADHLLRYLLESPPSQLAAEPAGALGAAVERAEAEIIRSLSAAACNAGSTLLAALLLDDKLHVANVGDCRAVLARGTEALQITTDHKPHAESEAARIARDHAAGRAALAAALADAAAAAVAAAAAAAGAAGGAGAGADSPSSGGSSCSGASVDADDAAAAAAAALGQARGGGAIQSDGAGSSPIVTSDGYLYGELAVARALGSQHLKRDPTKRGFTHVPDLFSVQLAREDDLLLLASDGLWDKVENADAVASARRCYARDRDPSSAARVLVDRAVRFNSTDNISVVVVALHDRGIALPKTNSRLFLRPPSAASSHGGAAAGGGGGGGAAAGSAAASPDCVGGGVGGGGLASAAGSAAATPAQSRPATPGSLGSPGPASWAAGSPAGPGRLLF